MPNRITIHPDIHFGKPCVAGTRITVQNVLELVREGISFADIIRDYYPDLTTDDLRACLHNAIGQDERSASIARALAVANETAISQGADPTASLITITEEPTTEHIWRIHYGPRNYIGCRGGDLIVLVEEGASAAQRVIRGQ